MTTRHFKLLTLAVWLLGGCGTLGASSIGSHADNEGYAGRDPQALQQETPQIVDDDTASHQDKPAQSEGKTAEEALKNIQIFKGLPAEDVMRAMAFFTTSLGVDCTHCHVAGEFEKEDKEAKQTARKMYAMVQLSNKVLASNRVSCYACHRGHVQPEPPPDSWKTELDDMRKKGEQDQRPAESTKTFRRSRGSRPVAGL